jgi:hypothetical protein
LVSQLVSHQIFCKENHNERRLNLHKKPRMKWVNSYRKQWDPYKRGLMYSVYLGDGELLEAV